MINIYAAFRIYYAISASLKITKLPFRAMVKISTCKTRYFLPRIKKCT